MHLKTITRWSGEHKKLGAAIFVARRRGAKLGGARHLSPEQEKTLQKMIIEKTPDQLKLALDAAGGLRTHRSEVCAAMPIRTCGEYLKRWGFTPQKPARRAYEQNPAAVRRWMEETYPVIAAQARAAGAEIHWGDETGVRRDCQHGRCDAPKGQTPVVRLPARRFSVNMISTVTNQGKVRWMIDRENLNSAVFIRFLERLIKDAARKVFPIVDNLKVYHSQPVQEWFALHQEQIAIFYLLQPGAQSRRILEWRLESLPGQQAPAPRPPTTRNQSYLPHAPLRACHAL